MENKTISKTKVIMFGVMIASVLVAGISTYHLTKMRAAASTKSVVVKKKVHKAPKHVKRVKKDNDTLYVVIVRQ